MSTSRLPAPRVLKFGGAALRDGAAVRHACRVVAEHGGPRPVVVVSAHEGVTRTLEAHARAAAAGEPPSDALRIRHRSLAGELGLDPELLDPFLRQLGGVLGAVRARGALEPGERDFVLSFGERMSARLFAAALRAAGVPATPVDAYDLGLTTDSNHGRARPLPGVAAALREAFAELQGVPVVTGFLARDRAGNLTTLGPNGSDLSAALVAEALEAERLELWKGVAGVLTADPRACPDARTLASLGYAEAAELAWHGADVLHPEALEPARRARVAVHVRDVAHPELPGTRIGPGPHPAPAGRGGTVALAGCEALVRVRARTALAAAQPGRAGVLCARAEALGGRVLALRAEAGRTSVLVAAPRSAGFADELRAALVDLREGGAAPELDVGEALVAVVAREPGEAGSSGRGPGELALDLLREAGVEVREALHGARAATSAFVVARADHRRALEALHAGLFAGVAR